MAVAKYATKNLGMSFDEASAAFIRSRRLGQSGATKMTTSERTIEFYRYDVDRFFAFMQRKHPDYGFYNQLQEDDVLGFIKHLSEQDWSDATRQKVLRILKAFFYWIERDSACQRERMKSFRQLLPPIGQTEARLYVPTPAVMEQFLRTIDTSTIWGLRDYVVLCVLIDCGPRIGEICNLNQDCIMWDDARLFINKGKTGQRIVPLNADITIPQLKKWVRERESHAKCEALFIGRTGYRCRPNTFSQEFSKHRNATGVGVSPEGNLSAHTVRHYFCTYYLVNGGTLPGLQSITGHNNLSTLQVYMHMARQLTFVKDEHAMASPMKSLMEGTKKRRTYSS